MWMVFILASNRRLKPVPNTLLKVEFHGFDRSLQIFVDIVAEIAVQGAVHLLPHVDLKTGDVLNAPRQVPYVALCTQSRDSRTDCRAEPYTTQP